MEQSEDHNPFKDNELISLPKSRVNQIKTNLTRSSYILIGVLIFMLIHLILISLLNLNFNKTTYLIQFAAGIVYGFVPIALALAVTKKSLKIPALVISILICLLMIATRIITLVEIYPSLDTMFYN
ncbi:hypothetical protein JCM19294_144 [Nonlabens tegetincola]|uniref:Uncharacterized protein n=1 Tax=Nonlabens tegetincola TaxID=323273 RepID=A0A090Q773_9FLAO|nr:hypothetical protein [Nonlabens tegetincola]GAK97608.1 hypothetical protein JCM19294_144 [Nonlabens tegetincola]